MGYIIPGQRLLFQGHIPAINTLGWWALEKTKDYDTAFNYFNQAHLQNNPDAAHNLGHMFMHGYVPILEGKPDKVIQLGTLLLTKIYCNYGMG